MSSSIALKISNFREQSLSHNEQGSPANVCCVTDWRSFHCQQVYVSIQLDELVTIRRLSCLPCMTLPNKSKTCHMLPFKNTARAFRNRFSATCKRYVCSAFREKMALLISVEEICPFKFDINTDCKSESISSRFSRMVCT